MKVALYFIRETDNARLYKTAPTTKQPSKEIWIPRSIVSHTTKYPLNPTHNIRLPIHEIEVEDWFAEKNDL